MAEVVTTAAPPLVSLSEIAEIELFILKRMKEFTLGDHASVFKGSGFNFVGLRDWEPGDRMSSIDWAQSSFNNFSPMIMREFEQDSTGTVIAVADVSLSTRCGVGGVSIAEAIARSVAAGRIQMFDVETGRTRTVSRREFHRLAERVEKWQEEIFRIARDSDLDIVRVGLDRWEMETVLVEFVAERRLRKM